MENNPMEFMYEHFGKEKEEDQAMMNIANIFYEMGKEKQEVKHEDKKHGQLK